MTQRTVHGASKPCSSTVAWRVPSKLICQPLIRLFVLPCCLLLQAIGGSTDMPATYDEALATPSHSVRARPGGRTKPRSDLKAGSYAQVKLSAGMQYSCECQAASL